jgi:SnoaL-like domain
MTPERDAARQKIVDEHIRLEGEHDLEALVQTFGADPEWHNQAAAEILQGHEAIRGFYSDLFGGFPDFWVDIREPT